MTSLILSGIEHASLSSRSTGNAYQPCSSISNNWSALLGCLSLRFWSRMLHKFSSGFKSGDCDGQSNLVTTGYSYSLPQSLPPARIRWHHFDVCLGSLSCCQRTSLGPPKRASIDGKAQLTRSRILILAQNARGVEVHLVETPAHSTNTADNYTS